MKDKIQEMAKDIYRNSNYSEVMSFEIAKFNVENNYRKCGGDTVILTKDEFHSMIKTDTEAEEYGQQCWNDGKAQGVREFADFIISQMADRDYMGIKYKQGVFSENEIDILVNQFNDRNKENENEN